MDILGQVPPELSRGILQYLSLKELVICSQVSSRWRALVNDNRLWLNLLPDYKYVNEEWWNSLVDSGKKTDCSIMERYLTERKVRGNLKRGKSRERKANLRVKFRVGGVRMSRDGWLDYDGSLYLWYGKKIRVQLPEICTQMRLHAHVFSYNLRHLAIATENFVLLYEYEPPQTCIELLGVYAIVGCDGTTLFDIVECSNLDNLSVAAFIGEHARRTLVIPYFFTGVDSGELRLVVRVEEDNHVTHNLMMDLERKWVAMQWEGYFVHRRLNVMEGWDRNGICLWMNGRTFSFFDVNGERTRDIVSDDGEFHGFDILQKYNMAFGIHGTRGHYGRLYVWEKNSESRKQLTSDDDRLLTVQCHGTSVAFISIVRCVIEIISAPDWVTMAILDLDNMHMSMINIVHFSDSSIAVIASNLEMFYVFIAEKPKKFENYSLQMKRVQRYRLQPNTSIAFVRGHIICFLREGEYITMDFRLGRRSKPRCLRLRHYQNPGPSTSR